MTSSRQHLLGQAALCYEQAGLPLEAAQCRERAGELVAAAGLFRDAGELARAATCYRRAGHLAAATSCLLALGRAEAAAEIWEEAGEHLEAAWLLAMDAGLPTRARHLLIGLTPSGADERLRLRLATAACGPVKQRAALVVAVLDDVEQHLLSVAPEHDRRRLVQWAIQAADAWRRPDLGSHVFAAAHRSRLRGVARWWQAWAQSALGGTAGVPEEDL